MKNLSILIVIFISVIIGCHNAMAQELVLGKQPDTLKNDLQLMNIHGKVKSITDTSFKVVFEHSKITEKSVERVEYSQYNEKGNLVESKICHPGLDDLLDIYQYDENGKKEETLSYRDGEIELIYRYKYDDKGNMIEQYEFDNNSILTAKWISKYDEKGNQVESYSYFSDSTFFSKSAIKVDENGNKVEEKHYNSKGGLESTYLYKHNNYGDFIETQVYDARGDLKSTYTYKYKYDKKNNWIKKTVYDNEIPWVIEVRSFEYN
jgi:hypothetical protein